MSLLPNQPRVNYQPVTALTDVGAGPLAVLPVGEGFSPGTYGFNAPTDPYNNYTIGTLILVRDATATYLFVVTDGLLSKVAALVAVLSASSGAAIGSTLLFVVAPLALGLPNSYQTVTAAVTAAAGAPASLICLPMTTVEPATVSLYGGLNIFGIGNVNDTDTNIGASFTIGSASGPVLDWSTNPGLVTISNVRIARSGAGTIFNVTAGLGATSALVLDRIIFDSTVPSVPAFVCTQTMAISMSSVSCRASTTVTITPAGGGQRFKAIDCTFTGLVSNNDFSDLTNCSFSDGLTTGQGTAFNCYINRTTAGQIVDFNPLAPTDRFIFRKTTLRNVNVPGPGTPLITGSSAGVVVDADLRVTDDTDPTYIWATVHSVVSDSLSSSRRRSSFPAQGANFDVPAMSDIIDVDPTATITSTLPVAGTDLPGRRVLVRNISATQGFYLAPSGAETIDNQGITQPVYLPPLGVLEVEADRSGSQWRRVQPRNAGNVYVVAPDGAGIPNSYPSITAAKALIDKDLTVRSFIPVIEVYPGSYTENVNFTYPVCIRGKDNNPYAVTITGNLALAAGAANQPFSVQNIRILGVTTYSDSAFAGLLWIDNCVFDSRGLATIALSLATASSGSYISVTGCITAADNTVSGVFLSGAGRYYYARNSAIGTNRLSFQFVTAGANSVVEDNYFEGAGYFQQTAGGIRILVSRNRFGVEQSGTPSGRCIAAGSDIILMDELCAVGVATDRLLDTGGLGSPTVGRLRSENGGVPVNPAGLTDGQRQYPSRYTLTAPLLGLLSAEPRIHTLGAGSTGPYTLPPSANYPQGCDILLVNDSGIALTINPTAPDIFGPAGAANPQVIPAGGRLYLFADPNAGRYLIVSTV